MTTVSNLPINPDSPVPAESRRVRWAQAILRAVWLVAVPALLTGLVLRYGLPLALAKDPGALGGLVRIGAEYLAPVAAALFVLFAQLLSYWRFYLPGGRRAFTPRDQAGLAHSHPSPRARLAWGAALALAVGAAIMMRRIAFESYRVLSDSMLPTLRATDNIVIDKLAFRSPQSPRRGDVVVFQHVSPGEPDQLVKRIIGLPGDHIEMDRGHPIINGWPVPSCQAGAYVDTSESGGFTAWVYVEFLEDRAYLTLHALKAVPFPEPYFVKPREYFVLGDDRANSSDSRAWNHGRGGGVRLDRMVGLARWFLLGQHRNGEADFSQFLRPLGLRVRLDGLDTTELEQGISQCLRNRPSETEPPRESPPVTAEAPEEKHGT